MNPIEVHRRRAVEALFQTPKFLEAWTTWAPQIAAEVTTANGVYDLGSKLSYIFQSTSTGRGQNDVSGAGNAWECLVCWYLNLVFQGTGAVAIKKKRALVPEAVADATAVVYGNSQTNTESDLLVFAIPPSLLSGVTLDGLSEIDAFIRRHCRDITVGVVQCKTNWNDNAQIPMLWDMVYRARGFRDTGISVGKNGIATNDFKSFSYSFMTVPSQKNLGSKFKNDSMAVKRVRNLSGGNYWGWPSVNGVALSFSEIFRRNFSDAFQQPIQNQIGDVLATGIPDYFGL